MKLVFISILSFVSTITFAQIHFVGLTQTLDKRINIIYNENNYGNVMRGDTLYVLDVSAIHRFVVERIFVDSIDFFNFIGGEEYQRNGKPLSYFNKRVLADYVDTMPYGNYLLSRQTGTFFAKNNFLICVGFPSRINGIERLTENEMSIDGYHYDLLDGVVKFKDKRVHIQSLLRVTIVTKINVLNIVIVEHPVDLVNYLIITVNGVLVAKIFKGIIKD